MHAVKNSGDVQKTISIAILTAGQPPKQLVEKYGGVEYMLRNALAEALANIPRHEWHPKISLHLQAFNIMMAEFPDISQLDDGAWDAMVVTGSRMYIFSSCKLTDIQLLQPLKKILCGCRY